MNGIFVKFMFCSMAVPTLLFKLLIDMLLMSVLSEGSIITGGEPVCYLCDEDGTLKTFRVIACEEADTYDDIRIIRFPTPKDVNISALYRYGKKNCTVKVERTSGPTTDNPYGVAETTERRTFQGAVVSNVQSTNAVGTTEETTLQGDVASKVPSTNIVESTEKTTLQGDFISNVPSTNVVETNEEIKLQGDVTSDVPSTIIVDTTEERTLQGDVIRNSPSTNIIETAEGTTLHGDFASKVPRTNIVESTEETTLQGDFISKVPSTNVVEIDEETKLQGDVTSDVPSANIVETTEERTLQGDVMSNSPSTNIIETTEETTLQGNVTSEVPSANIVNQTSASTDSECPQDWTLFESHCYRYIGTHLLNFDDSEEHCSSYSLALNRPVYLVKIDNVEENTLLRQLWADGTYGTTDTIWIGYSDRITEGTWLWSDGTVGDYTNWYPEEPNNAGQYGQHCAAMWKLATNELGQWDDQNCDLFRTFFCEISI